MSRSRSRAAVMFDALELLADNPEVIVIRRQSTNGDVQPHWRVSTAGHSTTHRAIDVDALLVVRILMEQQERELP